ncbi:hypothetical protein CBR_g28492 [Chara braunii]|uniref:Uncharacterized protein n=1 Tax=Chara braunii TaxID=69332 RepID=A0A388JW41_CHABU|nr:hypothetical protein CBR_g28492 [Chara braunii]|eukprot:GBG62016.1 hypothetical protein CBR_g28492 [Chara braunii]
MQRAIIFLNGLEIAAVEAKPVVDIIWDQLRGRGSQVNFILEGDGRDRVNAITQLGTVGRRIIRDTVMKEVAGGSAPQAEPEAGVPEKIYGKPREEKPTDKVTAVKKKFRYQIPILTMHEINDTLSKLLGTIVSVSFQTMLQANPRLLKGLRQLLTQRRVEIDENLKTPEEEREEEAPQGVANLQWSPGDLEDLEKVFANIRLSLPDHEGGEVMRVPPGTKLSFHALPVGKLKVEIGTHYTDALVGGGVEITLIRRDFATVTGRVVNKEDQKGNVRKAKIEFGNKNGSGAINRPSEGGGAEPSRGRRTTKRKLYIGYMSKLVVGRGARKQVCRGPSSFTKGEGVYISSGSESEEEKADMGERAQTSDEGGVEQCKQHEPWQGDSEGGHGMCNEREDGKGRRESSCEERNGHDSCEGRYPDFEEGDGRRTEIPYKLDPKKLTGGFCPIRTEEEVNEEEEVQEVIEISSSDERDEISRPREERRPPVHQPREEAFT